MTDVIYAVHAWRTNAELIEAVAQLGYLRKEWPTLDVTYGMGTFWKRWKPDHLVGTDLNPAKSQTGNAVDFRRLPFGARAFHCVVLDSPYKLAGTPASGEMDERFGTDKRTKRQELLAMIRDGVTECARVLGDGYLLVKVMDQVEGDKVRWQTRLVTEWAEAAGLGLVDRFDRIGARTQPARTRADGKASVQHHARRNASQLLILQRGHTWR